MFAGKIPSLSKLRLSTFQRFAFAIVTVALAILLRWLLNPVFDSELPFGILFVGILLIARIAGLAPALVGIGLGLLSSDYFFLEPRHSFVISDSRDIGKAAFFLVLSIAATVMLATHRRMVETSEKSRRLAARQQAELQQIYASTPIGLGFLDENLRYLRVNDALAAFNGVPADQHPGRHVSEILSPEIAKKLTPLLTEVLRTSKPIVNVEVLGEKNPGSSEKRWVRASFYPVELGELKGLHGVVEDISAEKRAQEDLKQVEEQLRHAVKMEAIGRLAGGVAHDFNNLLMVISSYTELLLQQLDGHPGHSRKLHAIAGAAQRGARLTKQLLAFGRKQPLQTQVLELDQCVRNFEHLLGSALSENIEILLDLNSEESRVKIDPSQFEQALLNLAVNARDAMPNGGRLEIRTCVRSYVDEELRSLFSIPPGEFVEIALTDSGCGMSPAVQARIFDPFFTTKEQGKGTGLGLAMVYGVVKQSGGYIEVQSQLQSGTTFRIWLPTTSQHPTPQPGAPTVAEAGNGTILVVEDESALRGAVCESLTALGYRVLEAADGSAALTVIEQNAEFIDLVLTDAVMPRMGGVELVRRVRATHPKIKTVLMSGYPKPADPTAWKAEVGDEAAFLQKPFAHAELAKVVRQVFSLS